MSPGTHERSRSRREPLVVAFVADGAYAMPLAAAIASVIEHVAPARELRFIVVDGGLNKVARTRIARQLVGRASVEWVTPSPTLREKLRSLPIGYVGRAAYLKLFLPELVGEEVSRLLYLDCDVAVEDDLTRLWERDFGDDVLLAAQDLVNPHVSSPFGLRSWRALGRGANEPMFNSGVMLIDARRWRDERISDALVSWLERNYWDVQLCDQDALNAVLGRRWGRLERRWNVLPYMKIARGYCLLSRTEHEELLARASVLHFCGPGKPWEPRCAHPRGDRFLYYLDRTAWAGWRPSGWRLDLHGLTYYHRRISVALRRLFAGLRRRAPWPLGGGRGPRGEGGRPGR